MEDWLGYAPPADRLADRIILVTGATAGIGRAVAAALIRCGATVILHGRNERKLEETEDYWSKELPNLVENLNVVEFYRGMYEQIADYADRMPSGTTPSTYPQEDSGSRSQRLHQAA